nr:ras-interacting protein RIP3-like [Aedes albopictus]
MSSIHAMPVSVTVSHHRPTMDEAELGSETVSGEKALVKTTTSQQLHSTNGTNYDTISAQFSSWRRNSTHDDGNDDAHFTSIEPAASQSKLLILLNFSSATSSSRGHHTLEAKNNSLPSATTSHDFHNKPYTCVRCAPPPPPAGSRSCRSSTSSVRTARRELELQRLAEEKALQERLLKERQEEEEAMQRKMMEQEQERRKKAMQEKLELEKQFIERKFDLLRAELDEDDDDRSVRSRRSTRSVQRTVQTWVSEQEKLTMATGTGVETIPTGPTSNTGTLPKTTSAAIHDAGQAVNTSQVGLPAATTIDLTALNISPPSSRLKDQLSSVNMIISPPAQSTNQRNSLAACLPQQVGQHQQQKHAGQHQPRQHRESSAFVDTTDTVTLASKTLSQDP